MAHNNKEVLKYWNQKKIESMYDKNLLNLEIKLIKEKLKNNSKILDAGCGEGEGSMIYSDIPGSIIHAVDFSETRLKKAEKRLKNKKNIFLKKVDFLNNYKLDTDYDFIISQRFLINLMKWSLQKKVITDLMNMLNPNGTLLIMEGYVEGVNELNEFRSLYNLSPIPIKWHNLFLKNNKLISFMKSQGYKLIEEDGLGEYFLLTRGLKPIFSKKLNWNNNFNKISSRQPIRDLLSLKYKFSRLKLWGFSK